MGNSLHKFLFFIIALCHTTWVVAQDKQNEINNPFKWQEVSISSGFDIPKGAFMAKTGNGLIVAGGELNNGRFSDEIYRYDFQSEIWEKLQIRLPKPLGYGTTVLTKEGMYIIGGRNENLVSQSFFVLPLDQIDTGIQTLTNMPLALHSLSACVLDNTIYLAGGFSDLGENFSETLLRYNITRKTWETQKKTPIILGNNPAMAVQNNGEKDFIYVLSSETDELLHFNPIEVEWKLLGPASRVTKGGVGFPVGSSHIMYMPSPSTGSKSKDKVAFYHTITDRWLIASEHLEEQVLGVVPNMGNEKLLIASQENGLHIYQGISKEDGTGLSSLDIFTFCIYFVVLLYMGYRFSKRIKTTDDYFRGGKRIPAWAAGISIVATKLSAVTFMSIPAKVFATDWLYFLIPFNSIVLAYFVVKVVLPFFQRINLTSAYEYLEIRFNTAIRIIGSISYLLWEIGRVGVLLLLPAIVISVVTNIDLYFCIVLIGVVATIYTLVGGIEAVVWTDVVQVFVMLLGILIALFVIISNTEGSFMELVESARSQGKLKAFDFDLDLTKATVLVIVLGWIGRVQEYVSTQSVVQRFMTTKNEKEASKSMWISALVSIPVVIIFYIVGTALYMYYQEFPQNLNPMMEQTDAILPTFFITQLPIGIIGLVIAAIFAAAMSSLDSAMNSMSTVIITDYYKRFKPSLSEAKLFKIAKYLVAILGVFGTLSAIMMGSFEIKSLFDQLLLFMGLTGGGLAGMFLLGMLTNKANSYGVIIGFVASSVIQYHLSFNTNLHFLLYATTGLISCFVIGYFASLILPDTDGKKEKFNIYHLRRERQRNSSGDAFSR